MKQEYILMTGAPGSKWSAVNSHIYSSPDTNSTDFDIKKTYNKTSHLGTYFGPGMEYDIDVEFWDLPFTDKMKYNKIIKSHNFAHRLDDLKQLGYPIVLVYRESNDCMEWWLKAGGFDITYPDYTWYKNEEFMKQEIQRQNENIVNFIDENINHITYIKNSYELHHELNLDIDSDIIIYDTEDFDVKVYLYKP